MTNLTVLAQGAQRPSALPQTLAEARAGIDATIAAQPLTKASGYVKVDDVHYHVAKTPSGPIVSLLEWRNEQGERPGFSPVHNLFAVDLEARDKAVLAWTSRHASSEATAEARSTDRSERLAHLTQPPAPMKPVRSGAR